jgi:hypothetical protein
MSVAISQIINILLTKAKQSQHHRHMKGILSSDKNEGNLFMHSEATINVY